MKQCGICGTNYEDRIRHCPRDGTALSALPPADVEAFNAPAKIRSPRIDDIDEIADTAKVAEAQAEPPDYHELFVDTTEQISSARPDDANSRTESSPTVSNLPSEDLSGRILNNTYRLERKIGLGGMGAVYQATHLKIGDSVAIKFIAEEMTSNPRLVARFQREALAARRIAHPDAVTVYEMSETADGMMFIVMQYVEGERLDVYLNRVKQLTARRILHIVRCNVDVLDAAHRAGI